jgi:hypothetical protein
MSTRTLVFLTFLIGSTTVAYGLNCFNGRDACLREASVQLNDCLRRAAEVNQTGPTDAECQSNFGRSEEYCNKC